MPDVRVMTARPHRLLRPMIDAIGRLHQSGEQCVMLVPEQFTLQAEREIMGRLRLDGLFSIEVISPTRLRHRVLAAVGTDERIPLTAAGQQMAIGHALETCADRLRFYRASVSRRGFAQKLTALIADMKRGGLQPETLLEYAQSMSEGMQKEKFADLALLYGAYEQTLKDRLGDGDDLNRFLSLHVADSGLTQGRHVFVYGFDVITEPMSGLLCAVADCCESLTIGLISDGTGAADEAIYLPVRQSAERFRIALREHGIDIKGVAVPASLNGHAPAIAHLDDTLFAHPQKRFTGEQSSVYLSQYHSPYEEATAVSREILRLNSLGESLERIAVIYPDQNGYPFAVAAALADSGLAFYTDDKLPALSHVLVQFVLASLRAAADGFRNEDVFTLMKTGYAPIGFDEACLLENYAREFGIANARWLIPFQKGDPQLRDHAETLRQIVIRPLVTMRDAIVAARNSSDSLQAVVNLLTDVNAYDALKREEESLLRESLLVRAGQNSQVWQTILELIGQLSILYGGKRIPLKHIADRFESGFSAITLAALPPAAHMLHAGILGHYLSGEMDTVFLLGLNDGILARAAESLLTEDERAQAHEGTQTFLGMTGESRLLLAKLDIKRAITLPKKRLYLSYAATDPAGGALLPRDLAGDIADRLFEDLPEMPVSEADLPISSAQAIVTLSDLLRRYADGEEERMPDVWKKRLAVLLSSPATSEQAFRLMRAAGFRADTLPLASGAARTLFGDRTLSVSRLEDFAACPFRHFVTYGLRPEEIKNWEITPIEKGNFFHDGMQRFAQIAAANPAFPHITREEVEKIAGDASDPLIRELRQGPMGDGARNLAALEQAKRVMVRACAAVTDHLASGRFRVDRTEARFGYPGEDSFPPVTLRLSGGTEITLHGRIDRIDRYDGPEASYRRVVDYKSGAYASLDAAELWHGTQLQLMLYLDAVTRSTGDCKPAGAFYFHLFDPMAKTDSEQSEAVQADIRQQLQMNGVALADPEILGAMDAGETPVSVSSMVTKAGAIRKNAKALDERRLTALMDHSIGKATAFSEQMLAGDISVQPVRHGAKESCTYCEYRSICGYDPLASGSKGTDIYTMSIEELADRLDQETKADPV